jgi:hypothetical protein
MKICKKTQLNMVMMAVCWTVLLSGCASEMMSAGDRANNAESTLADYPDARNCSEGVDGGCFHGSMQCTHLDLQITGTQRSAVCLNENFKHTIAGEMTNAVCFERENMSGEPCQVCQTQAGETLYDDCMVDAEMRADHCEEDVEQLRDGHLYECDICRDEDGAVISESCRPKYDPNVPEGECASGEQGPYICEHCTLHGEVVFSECTLKAVDPLHAYTYSNDQWVCVDLYGGEGNELLRHNCSGGDVDAEKEERATEDDESMSPSGENETVEPQHDGGSDGSSDGNSDGSSDGSSDGVQGSLDSASEDNCEDYFPNNNTMCTRCFDEVGTVISDDCVEVDRRANRCELLEMETETCVFCINEIHELVEQTCEPKISSDTAGQPDCMNAKEGNKFCRLCGDDPMNPTEKVCMSEAPVLECAYEEVYHEGQACAKTCMVCTQEMIVGSADVVDGSDNSDGTDNPGSTDALRTEVFRSCEGNAGGHEPAPPVCESIVLEDEACQVCRDPNYNIVMASTCSHANVTQETHVMGSDHHLECAVTQSSSVLAEALCLRNHSCGGTYMTDEASNTYGMDPLCGASDVLTRNISTCDLREVVNMTPSLNGILVATAGELAQNIIAFYLMPIEAESYVSEECLHFGLSAIVAADTVGDYQQLGWE